ncbi:hypothetical protein OQA88_3167 [Cercophora sp. LCS_1]
MSSEREGSPPPPPPRKGLGQYRYTPLPTPTSVRLLRVEPLLKLEQSEVRCRMEIVDLTQEPEFIALSYTWGNPVTVYETSTTDVINNMTTDNFGDFGIIAIRPRRDGPEGKVGIALDDGDFVNYLDESPWIPRERVHWDISPTRHIECDGMTLDVGESLFGILRFLSFTNTPKSWSGDSTESAEAEQSREASLRKPVWIDAICINQNDLEERKAQVMLMGQIYRSAKVVMGWLGPKDRLAKLFVRAAGTVFDFHLKNSAPVARLRDVAGMTNGLWFSIFAWFQRLWFRRAWVAQEAVFAKDLHIFVGPEGGGASLPWMWLVEIVSFLHKSGLLQELNTLGQALLTGQPLQGDVRRLYQDDLILDILGSCRANGSEACPRLQTQPPDAYSFILGIQEVRERLNIAPSNRHLAYGSDNEQTVASRLASKEFPGGSSTVYRANLVLEGPELGQWNDEMSQKEKMLALARYRAIHQKHNLICALVSEQGKGFIMELPRTLELLEALSAFRSCGSTDPRDKVYAFLGISTKNSGITPDYTIPVADTFKNAAASIITSCGSLEILSHIQDPAGTGTAGLPSWVPDFACPLGRPPLTAHFSTAFNASGRRRGASLQIENDSRLWVEGCKVGDVAQVFSFDDDGDETLSMLIFGLQIPTLYPCRSNGSSLTASLEDFPVFLSHTLAEVIEELKPIYPDAKLYIAIGGTPVEAPLRASHGSAADTGEVPSPPSPSASEILWRTLIADGWKSEDHAQPGGTIQTRSKWGQAFSDWLLCSILDSYRLMIQVLNVIYQRKAFSQDDVQNTAELINDAKKRFIAARIRPKLDAWLDLSMAPWGGPVSDKLNHVMTTSSSVDETDISTWFTVYVEVVKEYFEALASLPELEGRISMDEDRVSLDPNLPGALELLVYQLELQSRDTDAETSVDKDGETWVNSMGDTKNLFDETTRRRITDFDTRMREVTAGRCMLLTEQGFAGLGPKSTSPDGVDQVWLLRGASVPFILRPVGGNLFRVVGESYICGIMGGEAVPVDEDGFVRICLV